MDILRMFKIPKKKPSPYQMSGKVTAMCGIDENMEFIFLHYVDDVHAVK